MSLKRSIMILAALLPLGVSAVTAEPSPQPGSLEPPPPRYEVRVEKSVFMPMRDGIHLSTDLYFPQSEAEKYPIILMRTPYSKNGAGYVAEAMFFARRGFAVAVQDFRGKFESEGVYTFNLGHREDGYDTFQWLVNQPWSNGKIGTYGCSYVGEVQLYQAPALPPGLAAMIPQASGSMVGSAGGFYNNAVDIGGGAWPVSIGFDWFLRNGSKVYYGPPDWLSIEERSRLTALFDPTPDVPDVDYEEIIWSLPVIDMLKRAGAPPTDYEEILAHSLDLTDPWWDQFDHLSDEDRINVPTLFIESWNDWTADAALYLREHFEKTALTKEARQNQFAIISPMQHCRSEEATKDQMLGDLDVGDPRFGHYDIYIKWFEHWLTGRETGITRMPKIQYYLLGKNEWRATNSWPVPGTELTKFYLQSGGRANSHYGDGKLSLDVPLDEPPDSYEYDPVNPVRSFGVNDYIGSKPVVDQRPIGSRHDVLVYTTEPLQEGVEMTGDIEVILYVSSTTPDTDFVAKLIDVYPDGRALNLRENIMRARFRNGRDKPPSFMQEGEVYKVPIRLGAYSNYFAEGHRIRLHVTSSSFPRYDRNLNTGGPNYAEESWRVAVNTVHHSGEYPSHVILPLVNNK